MRPIEELLLDLDARWEPGDGTRLRLRILGSTALFLKTTYVRGTKDTDVLETDELRGGVRDRLLALAGRDTAMHRRHRLYFDLVGSGFPFLPRDPLWHPLDALNASLRHFEVDVLDVTDVVVSKLARFHGDDRGDISAMIRQGHVEHGRLVERFRDAVERFLLDARSAQLPRFVDRLNRVERDDFGVEETEIELPGWIGE